MFKHILVPVERIDHSEDAARLAFQLAERDEGTVHLLHVVDTTHDAISSTATGKNVVDRLQAEGEETVESIQASYEQKNISIRPAVEVDPNPHRKILEFAKENDVDLIVMPTHNRSGVSRFFLGSTTERVLRGSEIPVLAVPINQKE